MVVLGEWGGIGTCFILEAATLLFKSVIMDLKVCAVGNDNI